MVIDSHCHLHDPSFADLGETMRVALTHDVWGVIGVGIDPDSNARTVAAATAFPKAVWPCLGFHPDHPKLDDDDPGAGARPGAGESRPRGGAR